MPGTLFVVATPIGNLEDLTFRALRTLKEVDLIAAEDTRRTAKLLAHYEIRTPLVSVREHNETREAPRLVARMADGASIALVTDAGTPGIADPGAKLVRAARDAGLRIVPIPGPSAVTAALSVSGFSGQEFVFLGFPPPSGKGRTDWFARVALEPRIVVFFEAPHRIERTLGDIAKYCTNREYVVNKELTKIHESSFIWPTINSDSGAILARGEFVVVLGPLDVEIQTVSDPAGADALIGRLTDLAGFDVAEALRVVAISIGSTADELKKAIKKHRISVKRQSDGSP